MESLGWGREARRPTLSSFGQRDLERYLCSKSKMRKRKTTHFHQLSGGEDCHPTQWELGSRLWTEVSLVQAKKKNLNALRVVFGTAFGQMGEMPDLAARPRSSLGKRRELLGTG